MQGENVQLTGDVNYYGGHSISMNSEKNLWVSQDW